MVKIFLVTITFFLVTACGGNSDDNGSVDLEESDTETGEGDGLVGHYYEGFNIDSFGNIIFSGLNKSFTRTDPDIDFWDTSSEFRYEPISGWEDNYSIEWKGYIKVEEPGQYGFATISDDGSQVWINGELVVDNSEFQWYDWEDNVGEGDLSGQALNLLQLELGMHEISVRFYEAFAFDGIELWWLKPGSGESNIPYIGTNFGDIPPVFNATTNWEIVPKTVLYTSNN